MDNFETYLLILGALLALGALASGIAHRSIVSLAIIFMAAGIVLGGQGFGVIELEPGSELVKRVTELTLLVILLVDGLEVERGVVRKGWHVPLRSLIIAMPLTAVLIAFAARYIVGLSWGESFLLGALLSPTDPVLTSSVVTNRKIPARIRNSLNLESGLNDGLALPAVLIFAAALMQNGDSEPWWQFLLRDLGLGGLIGIAGGFIGIWVLDRFKGKMALVSYYQTLYVFALGLTLYGIAVATGGNGFICVYVGGIMMASRLGERTQGLARFSRDVAEVLKLSTFVIFGSLLVLDQLLEHGAASVVFALVVLFVVRMVALPPALLGTRLDWWERIFMSWFGPRGVACIAYSILLLSRGVPGADGLFHLTALVVFGSIIIHGASDTPLANRFAARESRT